MSDQPNQQQQIQIRMDESKMVTTYANTIRTSTTQDEVALDFGFNLPMQQAPDQPVVMNFQVGSRVIMNWQGAKRLMMSLQQLINNYENAMGPIEIAPQPRQGQGKR